MTLLNIFGESDFDDWSGKKTVKMGQVNRNRTASISLDSDVALPYSSGAFTKPIQTSPSRDSTVDSSKISQESTTDASTDDNSTIVLSEGQVSEHDSSKLMQSDEDSTNDDILDAAETHTFEEEGFEGIGCMSCGDLNIEVDPEEVNFEAKDYWQRVKHNRKNSRINSEKKKKTKKSRHRRRHSWTSSKGSPNKSSIVENYDQTQIEVVHDQPSGVNADDLLGEVNDAEAMRPKSFVRKVKKLSSKSQRALLKTVDRAVSAATAAVATEKSDHDQSDASSRGGTTVHDTDFYGCEVEFNPKPERQISKKLGKIISKGKLIVGTSIKQTSAKFNSRVQPDNDDTSPMTENGHSSPDTSPDMSHHGVAEIGFDISCASSTDTPYGDIEDKYKSLEEKLVYTAAFEEKVPGSATEELLDVVPASTEELEAEVGKISKSRDEFTLELENNNNVSESEALQPRPSLIKVVKSMRFNSGNLSHSIMAGLGASTKRTSLKLKNMRTILVLATSKTGSLKELKKYLKKGVIRLQKMNTKRSLEDANLVVCIDGKGDRLNPADPMPAETTTNSDYDEDDESSDSGIDNASGDPRSDMFEVIEVDGPVVMQMCLMGSTFEPIDDEDDDLSFCSSIHSEVNTVNTEYTGWFLADREDIVNSSTAKFQKKESTLTDLGIETPFAVLPPDLQSRSSSQVYSTGSDDLVSSVSESDSASSEGDLNSVTTSFTSFGDSIMYELFPTSSFSSLTGIKCHALACGKGFGNNPAKQAKPTSEILELGRGRSRIRNAKGEIQKQVSPESVRNDTSASAMADYDVEVDSSIEIESKK